MTGATPSVRGACAVEMTGIRRAFGTTVALDGIDLTLRCGEIHAVLGANGAGKTTLMRILAGLDRPDEGRVVVGGSQITEFEPRTARELGVALVQQHFTLVPTLTAPENLVLARPDGRLRPDRRRALRRLDELVDRFGLDVRPNVKASDLSVGEQQRLELLRALDADARVLVLDEPTAVLTDDEADHLLGVCRSLVREGRAVAIITHRLGEVFSGCDRVTVLRNGREELSDVPVGDTTLSQLAVAMIGSTSGTILGTHRPTDAANQATGTAVGDDVVDIATTAGPSGPGADAAPSARSVAATSPSRSSPSIRSTPAAPVERLGVTALRSGRLVDVDLSAAAGEILGIAGVDGNGQADLEAVLCGRVPPSGGTVTIDSVVLPVGDPRDRVAAGVAYIPSDRYRYGLVRAMEVSDNLELGRTRRVRRRRHERHREATTRLADWQVRSAGPGARAASLSGGNAQKLVLARELDGEPGVVIACYPTRGLDPGAAATVAERLIERARRGAAVLWIGAELDELFAVADRIAVLSAGRVAGEFLPPFDRSAIGLAMTRNAPAHAHLHAPHEPVDGVVV